MIQKLIDAISLALSNEFGGYRIYTESVEQNLITPAFLVRLLNPTNEKYMNNKYKRTYQFAIQYIPDANRSEYNDVIERLFLCLENITALDGETFEANNMNAESQSDQALTFVVNYNFFVYKEEVAGDPMVSIQINQTARS